MGWSLKGIIGGALVGGAGAAEKHFVAEDNMARELAAKKEMADYTSEIEFNKTKRLEEWRAANKDTGEMRERESISENTALASDAAIAAGEKPGTVGYHASMADFFARSGRPELAEKALAEANRIRTDDTKDQIAAARLDAANARAARGGGGGGGGGKGGDSKGDDAPDIEKSLISISKLGVSSKDGEAKADAAAPAVANAYYAQALGALKDPRLALDATRKMMIRTSEHALDNGTSLRDASKAVGEDMKTNFKSGIEKSSTAREKGILQYPEEAPESDDPTERNLNYLRNQGESAAQPKQKRPWYDPRSE